MKANQTQLNNKSGYYHNWVETWVKYDNLKQARKNKLGTHKICKKTEKLSANIANMNDYTEMCQLYINRELTG